MNVHRFGSAALALCLLLPTTAPAADFQDVLDTPVVTSPLATRGLINGLTLAGQRVVGVGQRGHIVYSDDQGANWQQATVPVSSDLVAVSFPSPQRGWAVGHDGVVLTTTDAGATWHTQLDGHRVGELMLAYYQAKGDAQWTAEAERFVAQGAESPFLDVWFADEQTGFVVGAFNLILQTTDGGATWTPWLDRTENPQALHLYAIRPAAGELWVTGEQGLVLRLDAAEARFRAVETPYKGSYFGLTGTSGAVIVFGLRGNAYRSTDLGEHWIKLDTGLEEGLTAAASDGAQAVVLASQAGRLLMSRDGGAHFAPVKLDRAIPASAVQPVGSGAVIVAGARGIAVQTFK
ncbi:WD40/YVTN/BNR-like repeat-containing protein [Denitromonas ohlonensis]|uniref:Glycosyl hydrolase n=2 Tax=Denitromonas TaxID=139331 RepID=A0A557REQ0_9RHOO|nr:YCF48-related protein [Denitromonas ohlonensis]TVO63607.1 glycosyl hydrolase [Denitromonas ohlonensis]TVO74141.1 glycosyl hydrolase [Denitromonas ohlonensis]